MTDRRTRLTIGDWDIHYTPLPAADPETVVLIHSAGPAAGGSLELAFDVFTGQWTGFLSLNPDRSVPRTPAHVVTEVLTLLDGTLERIESEVFVAALAGRYTPEDLLAAIRGSLRSGDGESKEC